MRKILYFILISLLFCEPPKYESFCNYKSDKFKTAIIFKILTNDRSPYCNLTFPSRSVTNPISLTFTLEPIPLVNFALRPSGQATLPIIPEIVWNPVLTTESATYQTNVKYRVGSVKFNLTVNDKNAVLRLNGTQIIDIANIPNQALNVGANIFTLIATNSSETKTKTITINRASQFVFLSTENGSINRFRLNEANNTLEPLSSVNSGFVNGLNAFTFDAYGDYLLVAPDVSDNKFKIYKVNFVTGDLTGLNNDTVFTAGFGTAGGFFAVADKTGRAIYLSGNNNSIQPIFINRQNDTISLGTIIPAAMNTREMQISPDNNSLLTGTFGNILNYYSINSDGNLTSQGTINANVTSMGTLAFHPDGTKLFIVGTTARRYASRSLTFPYAVGTPSAITASSMCPSIFPYAAVYSNNGQFVIFACETEKRIYSIGINQSNGDGSTILSNLDRSMITQSIVSLDMDLTNRYFVSGRSATSTNSVELNSISSTGVLTFLSAYNSNGSVYIFRAIRFLY
jgi:hypothetical protein